MGLYTKKKSRINLINIIFTFLLILLFYFIYFHFFLNTKHDLNNFNSNLNNSLDSTNNKFFNTNDINNIIEDFINNNPELILQSVKAYQINQSRIEKEQSEILNIDNIKILQNTTNNMFVGSNDSFKTIYEFVDYNCGYCQKFHNVILELINSDKSIRVEILQLPILSDFSIDLAKLVVASSLNGDFEKVHNYLYSSNRRSNLVEIFADLFLLDIDIKFIKDNMNSAEVLDIISKHKELSFLFKFNGTPAIVVGNQIIPGYIDLTKLSEIVTKEFPDNS